MYSVPQRLLQSARDERVELPEKGGERFSRTRRRKDQRVVSGSDSRPPLALWIAGFPKRLREPLPYDGVKTTQHASRSSGIHWSTMRTSVASPRPATAGARAVAPPIRAPCPAMAAAGSCPA